MGRDGFQVGSFGINYAAGMGVVQLVGKNRFEAGDICRQQCGNALIIGGAHGGDYGIVAGPGDWDEDEAEQEETEVRRVFITG